MNNFDDLFEQQPQAEAAPQKQESRKERPKRQWWQVKEEKQRKEAYATLDKIFGEFSEGAGSMEAYLDVQSRFPFHSARNALLIGEQCPDAVRVGGYKEWHSQGIEILEDEKRLPIVILEPGKAYRREDGSVGQNFYAKEVYDISQTTARDQAQPQVSYDDRLLLKGLIASSPVPIRAVEELPQGRGAMFSAEQNAILVKKGMDAPDIFRCVSLEVANVQLAQSMDGYSRETDGYKAYAVSYMEDYLEAVLIVAKKQIEVRSVDIARQLNVSKPSVWRAMTVLKDGGFLTMDDHSFLLLTDLGQETAKKIYERHCFFTEQLIAAGIDPKTAEADACRIEHNISDESFSRLKETATQKQD